EELLAVNRERLHAPTYFSAQTSDDLYEVQWQQLPLAAPAQHQPETAASWLILGDEQGIGAALAERLQDCCHRCRLCPAGTIAWQSPDAVADVLELADRGDGPLDEVVYLGSLDAGADSAAAERLSVAVLHLMKTLAQQPTRARLRLVTQGAQA